MSSLEVLEDKKILHLPSIIELTLSGMWFYVLEESVLGGQDNICP